MRKNLAVFKILFILPLLALAVFTQSHVPPVKVKKDLLPPPENLKYFVLGYNDMVASSLWVRLLQDFEYCEGGRVAAGDYVPPNMNEQGVDRILKRDTKDSKCNLGWVYLMLNSITDIQPTFKLVYETGATFLSVVVDDREGARRIYEKGLKQYPDDWELNFRAAYHYLWEVQDPQRAAELFNNAAKLGGPAWVSALSAALFTKVGQAQLAKVILLEALDKRPTGVGAERIKIRLNEVNKILEEKP